MILDIDYNNLKELAVSIPVNTPVLMLNLLRYKELADYKHDKAMASCTGREAYFKNYIPAFNKIASHIKGIQPFYIGHALAGIIKLPGEVWDDVALIEYPDFAAFCEVVEHPDYASKAAPHRLAALEDWRLIVTNKANIL